MRFHISTIRTHISAQFRSCVQFTVQELHLNSSVRRVQSAGQGREMYIALGEMVMESPPLQTIAEKSTAAGVTGEPTTTGIGGVDEAAG